jgi:hypothetical protein
LTAISEEWRESHVVPHTMITLAGHCAVARARRPDRDGWKRQMDWDELICIHEAWHTVVAVAVGHHQNGAAVEKTKNGCRGIAEHSPAILLDGEPDHPSFENFDKLLPDFRKATAYAQLAVGTVGWLKYLRGLWLRTDCILERHWLATKMLASELRERGVVRRDRAQDILDRWMPVRGGSMLEALGYQQPVQPVRHIHCGNSAVNVGGGLHAGAAYSPTSGAGRVPTLKSPTRNFSASGGFGEWPSFAQLCRASRVGGTVARRVVGSGPGVPGGAVRAKPYAVGRRTGRTQAFFSHGNFASKSSEDWCTDSRSGSGLAAAGVGGCASLRMRRLWAARRPARHAPRNSTATELDIALRSSGGYNRAYV